MKENQVLLAYFVGIIKFVKNKGNVKREQYPPFLYNAMGVDKGNDNGTEDGEVITTSYWYGVQAQEDVEVLEIVGGGFYRVWSDELGE